ncbi:MAG: hypothetical protein OEZ18_00330 [Candidatus Bathyarchaeota archaeon]|nr:hypothetical protein [Candidatus Bathyarchaeota archaeon]
MIEAIYILFRLLLLMVALIVIGEPLRFTLSKYSQLLNKLDLLQISVLNVYLGGLILYFIAMLPFHFFNVNVVWTITLLSGALSIFLHRVALKKLSSLIRPVQKGTINLCNYLSGSKLAALQCSAVLGIFLVTLWIQVSPLPAFVFGSIHDPSLHSLFVQLMLESQGVPATMQPYLSEGIVYPQAAHVFFAYSCIIFGYMPPEAIFHVTALFQALIVLSAYYVGKSFSSRRLGLSFAFIFFCVSRWPRLLGWGTNAYVVAFPLQFISLTFVPFLQDLHVEDSAWKKSLSLFGIGILLGYLAALHLTIYMIVMATITVSTFVNVLRKRAFYELRNLLIVFAISIIPISPFIYRFIEWYPYPGHNIGLPSDVIITPWSYVNLIDWLLFSEGISPYPPLVIVILGLMIFSGIVIYRKRRQLATLLNPTKVFSYMFLASAILVLLFHLQYVFPPISIITGEPVRPVISIYISLCLLVGVFNVIICDTLINYFRRRLTRIILPSKQVFEKNVAIVLTFVILFSIYSPFVYYTITQDTGYLVESYGKFAVTTSDDYALMLWMRDSLPKNSTVLVSVYGPGMFIPSVSHCRAIYPWVLSKDSYNYLRLFRMVQDGIMNATFYGVMKELGIGYIYIGSESSMGTWPLNEASEKNRKWDPLVFLSNPNFNLIKKVGNAYLFEVLYKKPEVVYEDSFEYTNVYDMGWVHINVEGCQFKGSGYVSTNSTYSCNGAHNLVITAKNEGGLLYANEIYRKIYVWDISNVTLSFYINATDGYSPPDVLCICIYDTLWNKSICFATPNSLYARDNSTTVLPASLGNFSYNISNIWQKIYSTMLPTTFFITIRNIDFDCIENIGHIGDISVKVGH